MRSLVVPNGSINTRCFSSLNIAILQGEVRYGNIPPLTTILRSCSLFPADLSILPRTTFQILVLKSHDNVAWRTRPYRRIRTVLMNASARPQHRRQQEDKTTNTTYICTHEA
ncbi:unnamed protein product [Ectocarpus sp. 8 AP-2014]